MRKNHSFSSFEPAGRFGFSVTEGQSNASLGVELDALDHGAAGRREGGTLPRVGIGLLTKLPIPNTLTGRLEGLALHEFEFEDSLLPLPPSLE